MIEVSSRTLKQWILLLFVFCFSLACRPVSAQMPAPGGQQFPVGSLEQLQDLPPGRLRTQLENLPQAPRERGLAWLRSFHFTEADLPSLHADSQGGILFTCSFQKTDAMGQTEPPVVAAAAVPVGPFPTHLKFHSRPGAANVLYINFSGQTVTNTQWNTEISRSVIPAVAFSTDADLTTFSDAEQLAIKRIWQRMAEDYAPFNIDVTTEPPASLTTRTAVALITRTTDANGQPNPFSDAGGVAYVNVFGSVSYGSYRPAWIYHNNLSNEESYIAEAASHEIGHNMGLSHDGRTDGYEYYGGHGSGDISWGPLMGTGYNRNVSQWSKGEYYLANNTQDDLATIAGKITYRTDDHGSTAGTATALVVTDGTNIVSTTPENDPGHTNTVNSGVLERNTDLDVFSFVTGQGNVRVAVNPWIMPAGTRGGNLDVLVELYSEAGALLLTNNPALGTTALIQTNLAEGKYYLHVRNSGAGNPTNSAPTGYTAYGSIGQYFISGYIIAPTVYIEPPVAQLQVTDLTLTGQASKQFSVTYSDDAAINVATIDSNDILVTGPSGYSQVAQFVSLSAPGNGTPRTATYSIPPPNGMVWMPSHNGTYTVSMQSGQVGDTEGAWVTAGSLGQFKVAVPVAIYSANMDADPGLVLDAQSQWQYGVPTYASGGPSAGFTGTKILAYNLTGNYPKNLAVKYAKTPAINTAGTSSLTLRFMRWLRMARNDTASIQVSTNDSAWINVWSSSAAVADTGWQAVQYALPASVAGSPTLRVRWGITSNPDNSTDIGWNIDDLEILGDGVLDAAPPVPSLSVGNVTLSGSPSHSCSVTYTDATGVRLSSLDSTDLIVTGPNGYSNVVEFAGADLPSDGSPITASYSIPAPAGLWEAGDNGTYTIILQENAVEDTLNNATSQANLGTFNVSISTASPGLLGVTPAGGLTSGGTVGGPFSPSSIIYTLTNSGGSSLNWTASKAQSWMSLSVVAGSLAAGASTNVTVSVNSGAESLAAGRYSDIVAFVNATTGSGNTSRSVSLTVYSPGFLEVLPADGLSSSGIVGGPFSPSSIIYTLTNSGGSSLNWTASKGQNWVSLSAVDGSLAAGASTNVTVSISAEGESLPAGSYEDSVKFSTGDGIATPASRDILLSVMPNVVLLTGTISAGQFVGEVSGAPSKDYVIESSADLVSWTAFSTNKTDAVGKLIFSDDASGPGKFYRLREE